jgi:hypothetical protein
MCDFWQIYISFIFSLPHGLSLPHMLKNEGVILAKRIFKNLSFSLSLLWGL